MDSIAVTTRQLVQEALKQSPTTGNGFGFGLATMVVFCVVCLGVAFLIWKALRSDNRRNWQAENEARIEARRVFNDNIEKRFDKLELQTKEAFDGLALDAKEDGKRLEKFGERLTRLETLTGIKPE